jgi:hypothetical protein
VTLPDPPPELALPAMMSTVPSPFTSPSASETGWIPAGIEIGAAYPPRPSASTTLSVLLPTLPVTISSLPSPFRSASASAQGKSPAATIGPAVKPP